MHTRATGRPKPRYDGGTTPTEPWWPPPSGTSSTSSGAIPTNIDVDAVVSIRASKSVCGGAPGQCYDAQGFAVDFLKSTLTSTTCVEIAGSGDAGFGSTQDVDTTKALAFADLEVLRKHLRGVVTSSRPVAGFDGPQWILEVTTKDGNTRLYAATSGCGPQDEMTRIESGWQEVWSMLQTL